MRAESKRIEAEVKKISAEYSNGGITVVAKGDMTIERIAIAPEAYEEVVKGKPQRFETMLFNTVNGALKRARESSIRGVRGSRGTRISSIRSKPSERPSSPPNKNPPSNPEQSHPIRDNQANGSRIVRPRGRVRGRVMRRFNRPRPRIINRRFRRVPNMMRGRRGMRRRFRPGFGFFRRRFNFARRSIFIKGLPKKITEDNLMGMLKKEGRVLRLTLLKDDSGESRGMAFAEFQNPRSAWSTIKKYRGYKLNDNTIFVAFKRDNNRYMSNYSRFFNRNRNIRRFNNYRRGFGPNSFQRQTRPMRNNVRGRGRGRGRGN